MWKYHWTAPLHYIDTPDFLCRYNYDRKLGFSLCCFLTTPPSGARYVDFSRKSKAMDLIMSNLIMQVIAMMSMVTRATVHLELSTILHPS
jgi:hypothetical protein